MKTYILWHYIIATRDRITQILLSAHKEKLGHSSYDANVII